MANSYMEQNNDGGAVASVRRDQRLWVVSLLVGAAACVALGLWLAGVTDGAARPWTGAAFVLAMILSLVVGVSKTSSA